MRFFPLKKIKEALLQAFILSLYTVSVPLYMLLFTYLLTLYQEGVFKLNSDIVPILLGTIWLPAFFALCINDSLRYMKMHSLKKDEKLRNYAIVFILSFSIYFLILGRFFLGANCLIVALSGFLVTAFSILLQNIRKDIEYLPPAERFYLYVVAFIFPLLVLLVSDVFLLLSGKTYFSILLAPISYVPGISGVAFVCLLRRFWFWHKGQNFRYYLLSVHSVVFIFLLFDILGSLYTIMFTGTQIFIVCFVMSCCLFSAEQIFRQKRIKNMSKF